MYWFFNHKFATFVALLSLLGMLLYTQYTIIHPKNKSDILGLEDNVSVTAYVRVESMDFRVFPEKRIPRIGNWDTFVDIRLVNCTNPAIFYNFPNIPTDTLGYGSITFPSNVNTLDASYRIYARGYSHLNRSFNCYDIKDVNNFIDLTLEGKELLAGETSINYDNYINSLDMSVLIRDLFTNSYKSDLNQDGKVNSLDFANQIYNLFIFGN